MSSPIQRVDNRLEYPSRRRAVIFCLSCARVDCDVAVRHPDIERGSYSRAVDRDAAHCLCSWIPIRTRAALRFSASTVLQSSQPSSPSSSSTCLLFPITPSTPRLVSPSSMCAHCGLQDMCFGLTPLSPGRHRWLRPDWWCVPCCSEGFSWS